MTVRKKAILALIITNIIWGAASPIFKWSLTNIAPFTLAFLRFSLASFLLFPFVYKNLAIDKKDFFRIFLIGFFGIGVNITFFFFGLKLAPSINAPMIAAVGPILILLLSKMVLKEKTRKKVVLGTLVSLLGALVIIIRPFLEEGAGDGNILGNLFFLLATLGMVFYAIISKEVLKKYQATTVTFWSFVIGSLIFLPFFIQENQNCLFLNSLDLRGFLGIVFGVFFSSTLAYFLYEWGVQKIAVGEVGIFTYIDPIAAILIAVPLLKETITLPFIFGSLLVFAGIYLAEGKINYHFFLHFLKLKKR